MISNGNSHSNGNGLNSLNGNGLNSNGESQHKARKMVVLGAIDQGTSSSRFIVFDAEGDVLASHQIEVRQIYPQAGWVEMDANEIIQTVNACIVEVDRQLAAEGSSPLRIDAVGVANQRETVVVWDKVTGEPLHNALVWLDSRTTEKATEYINLLPSQSERALFYFEAKCGLPIHPYFSGLKLRWLLDNEPAVMSSLEEGRLMFGTVDSWLIYKLTGAHVTDVTNASRTLLFDLREQKWSEDLCAFFNIPMEILPAVRSSAEIYGYFKEGPLQGLPLSGCLGDQQAALVGHGCFQSGDTKTTYGTGTFMLCNTGPEVVSSKNGLLSTVAYQFGKDPMMYALEGSGSMGGNVIQFLRDNFGFFHNVREVEELGRSVDCAGGVYFVPCFAGLYTPQWDPTARATLQGMTQTTNRAHIVLAALRAIAFQCREMIDATEKDLEDHGVRIVALKVDGGMTVNTLFNQVQADLAGRPVETSKTAEISAWGAAVAAAIGAGLISSAEFASRREERGAVFRPLKDEDSRERELLRWKEAVRRSQCWENHIVQG